MAARNGCSLVSTTMQLKIHLSQDSRFRETSLLTITLMVLLIQLHEDGFATIKASTLVLRRMKGGSLWFPEKSRLLVDVELTETATGEKRMAVDSSCPLRSTAPLTRSSSYLR